MTEIRVGLRANGVGRTGWAEPRRSLADFLREDLGLTGTHIGCEHGVCGACTVLIDGATARSCLMLAVQDDGRRTGRSIRSKRPCRSITGCSAAIAPRASS